MCQVVRLMYATTCRQLLMWARRHAVHQASELMCASHHMSSEWFGMHDEPDELRDRGEAACVSVPDCGIDGALVTVWLTALLHHPQTTSYLLRYQ